MENVGVGGSLVELCPGKNIFYFNTLMVECDKNDMYEKGLYYSYIKFINFQY